MSSQNKGGRKERGGGTTIIRRQVKKGHGGHHGGAWKVAFADFTLAMMALFMTLWIVNSVSKSERESIIAALHGQSIFSGNGFSPLDNLSKKLAKPLPTAPAVKQLASETQMANSGQRAPASTVSAAAQSAPVDPAQEQQARQVENKKMLMQKQSSLELGTLATTINSVARQAHMETNLEMEIVPQGLRVLIKDDQNRNMFERGSARIMPFFSQLLTELTPVFDSLDNKIIITGHTDAMNYKTASGYNNWNLSGDRALSARKVLEQAGMPADKVMQVSAMSDRMLLNADDPQGAENRRIEIMVLTHSASDTLYQFFGAEGEKVVRPAVAQLEQRETQRKKQG